MKQNKTFVRIIAIILAALMAGSVLVGVIGSVSASATSSISSLKDQQEQLKKQKAALEQKISDAEDEQFSILTKKKLLDEQIGITLDEIDNATALINEYTQFIADAEIEIAELEIKEQEQWEAYKKRVRVMEENGNISYLEVIFTATSFTDLLSRIDSVSEIMEKDRSIYNNLVTTRNDLIDLKAEKEEALTEQENEKIELESKKADLESQVAEAEALVKQYQANIDSYEDDIAEIEAENKRIEQEIANMESASNSSGSGTVTAEGSFLWPSASSRYVTSLFGPRNSPTAGASSYHQGIDIGASYGTDVLASKSGTVTTSTYSSSYGYYIIINHGDGTKTTYAHMSKLIASVGQTVSQGDVIGKVGSTGISTGPHLHFEISVNGTRVDPLKYFSNYTVSPNA